MKNKKLVGVLLAGMMAVSAVAAPTAMTKFGIEEPPAIVTTMEASAKAAVKTGCFQSPNPNKWTGWTYINATQGKNWKGQKYYKTPKIKICTFSIAGWRSGGTIDVQGYTSSGKLVKTYNKLQTAANIKLPGGYANYKVRLRAHDYGSGIIGAGRSFENFGACVYWSIDTTNNCYFK